MAWNSCLTENTWYKMRFKITHFLCNSKKQKVYVFISVHIVSPQQCKPIGLSFQAFKLCNISNILKNTNDLRKSFIQITAVVHQLKQLCVFMCRQDNQDPTQYSTTLPAHFCKTLKLHFCNELTKEEHPISEKKLHAKKTSNNNGNDVETNKQKQCQNTMS